MCSGMDRLSCSGQEKVGPNMINVDLEVSPSMLRSTFASLPRIGVLFTGFNQQRR